MDKLQRIGLMLILLTLAFASIGCGKAQASASTEKLETFLDSSIPGIRIQVNATAETQPSQNVTVMLSLEQQPSIYGQTSVYVEYFNLSVFGFVNGTYVILMSSITNNSFSLGNSSSRYNRTFTVPQQVWGVTYGQVTLTYNATYPLGFGIHMTIPYQNMTLGFTMTHVENVYLESIEDQFENLEALYVQLNQTFWKSFRMNLTVDNLASLNRTYLELQQNYTEVQGSLSELDNTRSAVTVLAITSVFFLATTLYLIMRRPKEYY
jgi:hypothetical protein